MNLDGMSLLVRSEVDACDTGPASSLYRGKSTSDDKLNAKLQSLVISSGEKREVGLRIMRYSPSHSRLFYNVFQRLYTGAEIGRGDCPLYGFLCVGHPDERTRT